jgi:hypothetical protein
MQNSVVLVAYVISLKIQVLWDVTPCSLYQRFGGINYILSQKNQVAHSSKICVSYCQTTQRRIAENCNPCSSSRENFCMYINEVPQLQMRYVEPIFGLESE